MSSPDQDGRLHARFEIGFENGLGSISKKNPIHEDIAIAAFIRSKVALPTETTYDGLNNQQWEYFRGLIWNDDPSCYLFNDNPKDNHEFSTGAKWLWDYEMGDSGCMIQRSHFGNLQFLHGMGTKSGEKPEATRARLVSWLEVMYKLACGNQGITEDDKLSDCLSQHFNEATDPSGDKTLRDLLLADTPSYKNSNISMRALGSCLHTIQDSYAIGHTQRRLINPHDLEERDKDGYLHFKPGTHGKWGSVMVFHTYSGQSNPRHQHYDGLEGAPLPNPKDIQSFNSIIGARSAIQSCINLLNLFADKTPWNNGVRQLLEDDIFRLDPEARPSDSSVDEPEHLPPSAIPNHDTTFEEGMNRKLAQLESGIAPDTNFVSSSRRLRESPFLLALLVILIFGSTAIVSHLSWGAWRSC